MKTTAFMRDMKMPKGRAGKQIRVLIAIIAVLLIGTAAWGARNYFSVRRMRDAHQAFVDGLKEFEKNIAAEADQRQWGDVVRAFDAAHKRYGQTAFGPSFAAYKARALIYGNKHEEAIKAMAQAVASLKKSSPFFYIYSVDLALMKIDSDDKSISADGRKELDALAENLKNPQRDYALYYAGLYALNHNEKQKVRLMWDRIAQADPHSVWLPLIQRKKTLLES